MKKHLFIGIACYLLTAGTHAVAQTYQFSNESPNVDDIDNDVYWTAERLQNAKPLELPKATLLPSNPTSKALRSPAIGSSSSSPGQAPSINNAPKNQLLFEPVENETPNDNILPMNSTPSQRSQGRSNAYFTSTRVVPAPDTQNYYPYRATGKLFYSDASGTGYICSGTVIQARLVITAGHCVYDGAKKSWNKNFRFIPAYHKGNAPFGTWDWSWGITTDAWISGKGRVPNKGDFAVLEMKDDFLGRKIGDMVGWHGFFTYSANPNHLTMLGYPANFDGGEWMHRVDSQYFRNASTATNAVEYGSDMQGGSSGGPWIENFGELSIGQALNPSGMNYVVAVTSYGPKDNSDYQGASVLDNQFSNTSNTGLYNKACANRYGNCK